MTQASGTTTTGAESDSNAQSNQQNDAGQDNGAMPETFDAWLATQPDNVKTMYAAHTQKLQSALQSERSTRSDLEKQLREAAKKQKDGSDEQANLTKMADELGVANRRADFYEAAVKPEVNAQDLEALWVLANAKPDDYFDKRGNVNFVLLKERHPGLFKQAASAARGNAGNGTGGQGAATKTNMNSILRRAAGRE